MKLSEGEKLSKMIVPPHDLLEMLVNMKSALDSDELLKPEFYTEQNLKSISGGHDVQWQGKGSTRQVARVNDFGGLVAPVTINGWTMSGIQYDIRTGVGPPGQRWARANIVVNQRLTAPSFEVLEQAFGKGWSDYPDLELHPHLVVVTHPKGNARIRYVSCGDSIQRSTIFEFAPDGTLYSATFSEEIN